LFILSSCSPLFYYSLHLPPLHSCPTRRSSDLAVYVVYNDEGILVVLFDQPFKSDQLGFVDVNIEDILLRPCIETFAVKHCHTTADFTVDQCTECLGLF